MHRIRSSKHGILKGLSSLENPFLYTIAEYWVPCSGSSSPNQIGEWLHKVCLALEDLSSSALHRQPTDLNKCRVMLNFTCDGAAGKVNTYC